MVLDWANKRYPEHYTKIYELMRIADRLGPFLTDEELEEIGVSKCYALTRLVQPGVKPDPVLVQNAKTMAVKPFEREVERELRKQPRDQELGEPLDFRGLRHAPVNEQGVVYLFGMVSRELGFLVESVRQRYPDCEALEQTPGKSSRWRRVRIEFEFQTSKFKHPAEGTDIVVCWEHDWPDCPVKRVIELKSKIKELPS